VLSFLVLQTPMSWHQAEGIRSIEAPWSGRYSEVSSPIYTIYKQFTHNPLNKFIEKYRYSIEMQASLSLKYHHKSRVLFGINFIHNLNGSDNVIQHLFHWAFYWIVPYPVLTIIAKSCSHEHNNGT
jgi:hypothetical protein